MNYVDKSYYLSAEHSYFAAVIRKVTAADTTCITNQFSHSLKPFTIMATKFYHCNVCGNVMAAVIPSGVDPFCCDCQMEEVIPNDVDASLEMHVPVVSRVNEYTIRVKVGSNPHPNLPFHYIRFIVVETAHGATMRNLKPGEAPDVTFLCAEDPIAVYAYCNKHGLWRTTL